MHPTHCRHVLRHPSAALISYFPPPPTTTINRKCRRYATVVQDQDQQKASSSKPLKNPFPYPEHSRPTPYQIFHLASGATQAEIKARYYELVKTHHPDSHHAAHLDSEVAHARFRGIQAAYDFLRGKTVSPHLNARPAPSNSNGASSFDPYLHEMARRRRAYYSRHGDPFGEEEEEKVNWKDRFDGRTIWHEDGWRERLVFGLGVVVSGNGFDL
ncbi:hypothetical protein CPC08DRAFT_644359 [Agrocybe pediades]|nr:hypothetical protein CPC08DRAFT_644359 [Agrocybe pediades]